MVMVLMMMLMVMMMTGVMMTMHHAAVHAFILPPSAAAAACAPRAAARGTERGAVPAHFVAPDVVEWVQMMLDSYEAETGGESVPGVQRKSLSPTEQAAVVANLDMAMASHDFLRDPSPGGAIYCYGNAMFLHAFGYPWHEFVELPSRYCVETEDDMAERQALLDGVKSQGPGGGTEGEYDNLIRVRKDRGRILLKGVHLWNVYEDALSPGHAEAVQEGRKMPVGQAVWIEHVEDYADPRKS